ncbi:MAG: 1-acyl-sn-glycerol-3-phosphate acyltransferase [Bacteroidales bacterium]|nr:1-acyl-sn-glycerol-3-phosphate acyltransferase [Bacteroidales bacterium]
MEKEKELKKYIHLYKDSKSWNLLGVYVRLMHNLFYKNIIVEGQENIPKEGPLIFAPNHQNALMDPLAVLDTTRKQIVFLARSDIFKNKLIAKILIFLKILPVFRIRDGKENLTNNDLTFDIASRVLESKQYIGIFPEARHTDKRRLLTLKKGIPRLAFMAEEKNDFNLNLRIIPVGIYYSKYNRMRSVLHVRYGEPIFVSDFKEEYLENPQKGMISLRTAMDETIRPLIIDIRSIELYDTYESIRRLYVKNLIRRFKLGKLTQINKFKADKITIKALELYEKDHPEKMPEIKTKVEEYEALKTKHKLSDQSIEKPFLSLFRIIINTFILFISLPVFIYGLVNNIFAYFPPKILVLKIKDKQFHSSIKFGWAIFVIPIVYAIQILIIALIIPNFWIVLAYAISLPIFGLLSRVMWEWFVILLEDYRLFRIRNNKPSKYKEIKNLHTNLILELDLIVTHWNRKSE